MSVNGAWEAKQMFRNLQELITKLPKNFFGTAVKHIAGDSPQWGGSLTTEISSEGEAALV